LLTTTDRTTDPVPDPQPSVGPPPQSIWNEKRSVVCGHALLAPALVPEGPVLVAAPVFPAAPPPPSATGAGPAHPANSTAHSPVNVKPRIVCT
jgi:hypothetical protein